MKIIIKYIVAGLFLLIGLSLAAQTKTPDIARVDGVILESGSNEPIDYAIISLLPANIHTMSNAKGEFSFNHADAGKATIKIQFIGMETIDTVVNIAVGQVNRFAFWMKPVNFRLKEITVVATQNKAGQSTSSNISRQAIDHTQATTLSDLMQLIPGVAIVNPSLTAANTISIRGTGNANSLGTAIIVDGAQLSNNANLQAFAATMNGSTGATTGDAAGGVDTRILSLDNIESIEIIRGIPSAEYGDLTSGAVLIKSRAGKDPLKVKFKTNPELYQSSISKGLWLGEKRGNLNISGDYLYAIKRPTEAYAVYQRFVAKALWTNTFGKSLYATTSLDITYGNDSRKSNPDDMAIDLREASQEFGMVLNHNAKLNINKGWLKSIEYVVAGRYNYKHAWKHELLYNATGLYSTAMTDGAIVTKIPGQQVLDANGNEVTHLNGSQNAWATILPNEYNCDWDIFGKEINANVKLKALFNKRLGPINNRIVVGMDYKTDGNTGKGKIYDEERPPLRTTSNNRAYRERAYRDIPFIHQLGIFAEDSYLHSFGERDLQLTAGARFDHINGKSVFVPRINTSFEVFPNRVTLKGGYGITAKAPSLLYLYPEKAYFDYRLTPSINPDNLLLCETRIFDATNPNLEIATNRKSEIGLDITFGKKRLSVTVYDELRENDYSLANTLNTFKLIKHQQYIIDQQVTGALVQSNAYNVFAIYSEPVNDVYAHNRGVEFELDLGRFDAIRTAFYLNGAWIRNTSKSTGYSFSTRTNGSSMERHIGVYAKGRVAHENETFISTLRMTHNIPSIGFAITLTSQLRWFNNTWSTYSSDMFEKYISYRDGKVYDFDPAKKDDPEFEYLFPSISSSRDLVEKNIPTLFFNINLTKEMGDYLTASFFANNMFNMRPMYESTVTPGSFMELGENIFFGFDLKISIK